MAKPIVNDHGRQMRSYEVLPLFGLPRNAPIPPTYEGMRIIQGYEVFIIPQPTPGRRQHRVLVSCSCKDTVPLGRMMQHLKRKDHP